MKASYRNGWSRRSPLSEDMPPAPNAPEPRRPEWRYGFIVAAVGSFASGACAALAARSAPGSLAAADHGPRAATLRGEAGDNKAAPRANRDVPPDPGRAKTWTRGAAAADAPRNSGRRAGCAGVLC